MILIILSVIMSNLVTLKVIAQKMNKKGFFTNIKKTLFSSIGGRKRIKITTIYYFISPLAGGAGPGGGLVVDLNPLTSG
jgi:hypothetical protein